MNQEWLFSVYSPVRFSIYGCKYVIWPLVCVRGSHVTTCKETFCYPPYVSLPVGGVTKQPRSGFGNILDTECSDTLATISPFWLFCYWKSKNCALNWVPPPNQLLDTNNNRTFSLNSDILTFRTVAVKLPHLKKEGKPSVSHPLL